MKEIFMHGSKTSNKSLTKADLEAQGVHPTPEGYYWTVRHVFNVPGCYDVCLRRPRKYFGHVILATSRFYLSDFSLLEACNETYSRWKEAEKLVDNFIETGDYK